MDSSPRRNSGKKGSLRKSGSGTGSRKNSSSNISRQGSQKSINKVSPQTPSSSSISEDNDNNNSTSPQQADEMVISSNESTPTTNKQSDISLNENHTAVPTTPTTSAKVSKAQQQQERNRFATAPVKQSPKHGNSSTNVDELSKRTSQQLQSKDPISMSSVHASPRHRRSVSPGRIQGNKFVQKNTKNVNEIFLFKNFSWWFPFSNWEKNLWTMIFVVSNNYLNLGLEILHSFYFDFF